MIVVEKIKRWNDQMLTRQKISLILSLSSVSQAQVSIIDEQPNLNCLFSLLHPPHTLYLPQYQNQFFSPKMVFCTSPLCVIRFIQSQKTAVINVDILMRRLLNQKQIILFTKNRLLKITLGNNCCTIDGRHQTPTLCLVQKLHAAAVKCQF